LPRRNGEKAAEPQRRQAVEVGMKAPAFSLRAHTRETVALETFRGEKNVVLYFYPKDETPGCTREACEFRDLVGELTECDTVVLGVSLDSTDSHTVFALNHELSFPLLSDTDAEVSKTWGVYREKVLYGKSHWGIRRTTFVIDKRGTVRRVWRRVQVRGHGDEVLAFVRETFGPPADGGDE
jgi:peroxiredoxin Q/BCP